MLILASNEEKNTELRSSLNGKFLLPNINGFSHIFSNKDNYLFEGDSSFRSYYIHGNENYGISIEKGNRYFYWGSGSQDYGKTYLKGSVGIPNFITYDSTCYIVPDKINDGLLKFSNDNFFLISDSGQCAQLKFDSLEIELKEEKDVFFRTVFVSQKENLAVVLSNNEKKSYLKMAFYDLQTGREMFTPRYFSTWDNNQIEFMKYGIKLKEKKQINKSLVNQFILWGYDNDFPAKYITTLIEFATGTSFKDNEVENLCPKEWEKKKEDYLKFFRDHYDKERHRNIPLYRIQDHYFLKVE